MHAGKIHWRNTVEQLKLVGPRSMGVSLLTAGFVGMVFTIQVLCPYLPSRHLSEQVISFHSATLKSFMVMPMIDLIIMRVRCIYAMAQYNVCTREQQPHSTQDPCLNHLGCMHEGF